MTEARLSKSCGQGPASGELQWAAHCSASSLFSVGSHGQDNHRGQTVPEAAERVFGEKSCSAKPERMVLVQESWEARDSNPRREEWKLGVGLSLW